MEATGETPGRRADSGRHQAPSNERIWFMAMRGRTGVVDDKLNVPLEDAELLAEVELTTNLIIAASESEANLSQDEIDRLLGVTPAHDVSIPEQNRRDQG